MRRLSIALVAVTAGLLVTAPAPAQNRAGRVRVIPIPVLIPEKVKVGTPAPDFTLPLARSKGDISLSSFRGKKPVVIAFGSYTSRLLRVDGAALEGVARTYRDKVEFLIVYIREAHPGIDVTVVRDGRRVQETFDEATSFAERAEHARLCAEAQKFSIPVAVDREDNATESAYVGYPNRLLVVGRDGKVAYMSPQGPAGARPAELDAFLKQYLAPPKAAAK